MNKNKTQKNLLALAFAFCAASVAFMIFALSLPKKAVQGEFIPPEFDASAETGEPKAPAELSPIEPYAEGMEFRASFCGEIIVREGKADVYFYNKPENSVWLMLRITDGEGNVLAETGIIRPGEYVKSINFEKTPYDGQVIACKVMAYEPETYYSKGNFSVKTIAKNAK